jgi:Mu-like prophage major head subunit gpT
MTINTNQIRNLLRPGLAAVFGSYDDYPSMWSEAYTTHSSKMAFELEVEMKMLGIASLISEGGPIPMDTMGQRVLSKYIHRYVSIGFTITRQAQKDNLYQSRFPLMAKALRKSMLAAKETLGASLFLNGFNAAYPIGDGQPLFSTQHPIDGGVYANTPAVGADLNEASLEAAIVTIQQFKDWAGILAKTNPVKLWVPPQLQFTAKRILGSDFRVQTPNNDISALVHGNYIPDGFRVNQYFNSAPSAWYLLTDAPDAFKHYQREEIETDVYTDFQSKNLLCSAIERYSFGVSNPRGAYGSNGP